VEARNLNSLPAQYKALCAPLFGQTQTDSIFTFVGNSTPNAITSRFPLEWGYTFIEGPQGGYVPHFYESHLHVTESHLHVTGHHQFDQNFQLFNLLSSQVQLMFLNQVDGPKPGDQPYGFETVNKIDGCFQCNPKGSDIVVLPAEAQRLVKAIPESYPYKFHSMVETVYEAPRAGMIEPDWSDYKYVAMLPDLPRSHKRKHYKYH
jgi:hypothetical protein